MSADVTPPLSFNQSTHLVLEWLAQLRGKPRPTPTMVLCLSADGPLDIAALEDAFNALVRRHEVLRAAFLDPCRLSRPQEAALMAALNRDGLSNGGIFTQSIQRDAPLRISVVPVSSADGAAGRAALRAGIRDEIARPFCYDTPPLMRVTVFTLESSRHVILVTLHHLVSDGWSTGVVRDEFQRLYNCRVSGRSLDDVPLPAWQYGDFARQQRERFRQVPDPDASYWTAHWDKYGAAQIKPSDIPGRRAATGPRAAESGTQSLTLSGEAAQDLRRLAKRYRTTTHTLCLAVMAVLFHRYTERPAVAWWSYCSNRTSSEVEGVIGWVAHGHLFGVSVAPGEPVSGVIARVREQAYDIYEHQEMPMAVLWNLLRRHQVAAPPAIFSEQFVSCDVTLARANDAVTLADGTVVRGTPHELTRTGSWPSLGLWSADDQRTLSLDSRYAGTSCGDADITAFLGHFEQALLGMARHPEASVADLLSHAVQI